MRHIIMILTALSFCSTLPGMAKPLSLDEQVHTLVNPVRPGLISCSSAFKEQYPITLRVLKLPVSTRADKFLSIVENRLNKYQKNHQGTEDPRAEALAVLSEPESSKIPDLTLKERLSLVSSCAQNFKSCDPKHLHSDSSDAPKFLLLQAQKNTAVEP